MIEPIAPDAELAALLEASGLPTGDLFEDKPLAFFGCREDGRLVAVIGVEVGTESSLLRSLAVAPEWRGRGLARRLVSFVEHLSAARGMSTLYLLTETGADFFRRLGYEDLERERAPQWIRASAQFSQLCPADADFLAKSLDRD